ncbi:MAG: hypothetical protein K2H01_04805 [Ruminococcus sp.]|nr:hypothetical protein [Ruminococcus sp.]
MTPEKFESLHKVATVFEKYTELLHSVRSLNDAEYCLLIRSLEETAEELYPALSEKGCIYCNDGRSFIGQKVVFGNDGETHWINFCPNCGRQLRKENENGT